MIIAVFQHSLRSREKGLKNSGLNRDHSNTDLCDAGAVIYQFS